MPVSRNVALQAEPALVYDSVQVFAHGLAALDRSHVLRPANLSCEREEPWDDGLSLYNYINSVSDNRYRTKIEYAFYDIFFATGYSEFTIEFEYGLR